MHLSFDSIEELDAFTARWNNAPTVLPMTTSALRVEDLPDAPQADEPSLSAVVHDATETTSAASILADQSFAAGVPQASAPMRKRRTKAEMEAARAADAVSTAVDAEQAANAPQEALEPVAGSNPFAASPTIAQTVQAALQQAGEGSAGTLAQIAEVKCAAPTGAGSDPMTWIPQRAAEIGAVDAMEHMRRCREFIGQKGQQVYQKTFPLAGTSANIMTYKPADCAQHIAAIEWMLANPDA